MVRSIGWTSAVGLAALIGLTTVFPSDGATPDIAQIDLVLDAAWVGLDPTVPVVELAASHDLAGYFHPHPLARPPGFYVVAAPLKDAPPVPTVTALNAFACLLVVGITRRMWSLAWSETALVAVITVLVASTAIAWRNPAPLIAGLVALTWLAAYEGRGAAWGIPLGLAAAVQVWPLLVIGGLVRRRPRMAAAAGITFLAATAGGLILDSVDLAGTVAAMQAGGAMYLEASANFSISARIPLAASVVLGLVALGLSWSERDVRVAVGVATVFAVVLSPLSWPSYFTATVPLWPLIARRLSIPDAPFVRQNEHSPIRASVDA